jgi:hypothetical protein
MTPAIFTGLVYSGVWSREKEAFEQGINNLSERDTVMCPFPKKRFTSIFQWT